MNPSFKEIAALMDPVERPSLRELVNRHRWVTGPPTPLSMRSITNRHTNQKTVNLRFLSYNTYLLRIDIPLGDFIKSLGVEGLLQLAGVPDVKDLFAKAVENVGKNKLCELLPVPLKEICKGASDIISFVIEHLPISQFDALQNLAGNVINLLSWFGVSIPEIETNATPAAETRAGEIGVELAKNYDLIALCEVWQNEFRDSILAAWPHGVPISAGPGPAGGLGVMGSGLLVIGANSKITPVASHVFNTQGVSGMFGRLVDSDLWAGKAVLFTLVDVRVGAIELYSAHLYSGGDLLAAVPGMDVKAPTEDEKRGIRNQQVDELIQFFKSTHKPWNVAIITGDFNIDAHNQTEYNDLMARMNQINMQDYWVAQRTAAPGYTNVSGHDEDAVEITNRMPQVCKRTKDSHYCDEPAPAATAKDLAPTGPGDRIDYIFVERPTNDHTFNLDLTRIRRRPFERQNKTEGMNYSSDHLGLDVTFIASPR